MNISRRLINLTTPINNFLKANKFFYKKRMGINHIESQKLNKIDNDFNELNQVFDWMEEGAEIQSHFYHEYLFTNICIIIYWLYYLLYFL